MPRLLAVLMLSLGIGSAASAVTMDWVTVGDPGNACDPQSQGCFGSVAYTYQIGKYEVTNAEYAEFLNAVARTDPKGLYDERMATTTYPFFLGGIARSGSPGTYTYSAIAGRELMPVNWVSFWDALRFTNWLNNGQPTGAQDTSTTEDGAYTIPEDPVLWANPRNPSATIFLPTEDEWYKAAYYSSLTTSYFDYPAGFNTKTLCTRPGSAANTGNCLPAVGEPGVAVRDFTSVGSYTGSASPSGTFDQGGNVAEWNDVVFGGNRGVRGGSADTGGTATLVASFRNAQDASLGAPGIGFRVASPIPEPGTGLLVGAGLLGLAASHRTRVGSEQFR